MADNKKYYWLKLKEDFFRNKEIKKLRTIAGGDTFTIIYLKMQLLSIQGGGVIEFEGTENNLSEQLALELDEDVENAKLTLAFLDANKLIEQLTEHEYLLNRVPKLIGSETDAAERMRKMREKRNIVTPLLQTVTQSKRKEIEKEIEIEKEDTLSTTVDARTPYQSIVESYNQICKDLPKVKTITDKRKKTLRSRWKTYADIETYGKLFKAAQDSDFLSGRNGKWTGCSFDWLINENNMVKVLEGNYENKGGLEQKSNNPFLEMLKEELEKEGTNDQG